VHIADGYQGPSFLELDKPTQFHGIVELDGPAAIDLNKLAADSYTYNGDTMTFYRGAMPVDTLRFYDGPFGSTNPPIPFAVAQGTSTGGPGIEIYATGTAYAGAPAQHVPPHGADLLPVHT